MAAHARFRWLPRFSMRTGLVFFLVLGTGLGLAARWIREVRERGEAQRALLDMPTNATKRSRSRVAITYAPESRRNWFVRSVRYWVHPEYDRQIDRLSFVGDDFDDSTAVNVSRVFAVDTLSVLGDTSEMWMSTAMTASSLKSVSLNGPIWDPISDFQLDRIPPATELQQLHIVSTAPIREEFIEWLCRAPKLNKIDISEIPMESLPHFTKARSVVEFSLDMHQVSYLHPMRLKPRPSSRKSDILRLLNGLPSQKPLAQPMNDDWRGNLLQLLVGLADCEQLTRLRLSSAVLEEADLLREFCRRSKVQHLQVVSCNLSPESLREIAKLKNLRTLDLSYTPLELDHLETLMTMKSLREIDGLWYGDEDGEEQLAAALPHCKITPHLVETYGEMEPPARKSPRKDKNEGNF